MGTPVLDRILNRLEEWIIVTLIAAATALTFVAVVHRYGASNSANLARWAGLHHLLLLKAAANWVYDRARFDQSVLGERTLHLHVRVDGEIRRRARRAHRHPCRRRCVCQEAFAGGAQAGHRVRAVVRRAVHRRYRYARRSLCLRARSRPGLAGARMAELDHLSVHPARLLPDVLSFPASDVAVPSHRVRAASGPRHRI